jgi:hypothetical protein
LIVSDSDFSIGRVTTKLRVNIAGSLLTVALSATAETRLQGPEMPVSPLESLLWSVLPILIVAGVVWFFFVRFVRKNQKRSEDYMAAMLQHNDRVERLLEQIAAGLPGAAAMSDRAACAECGGVFNVQDMIKYENRYICARCKPIWFQKIGEGVNVSEGIKSQA